MTDSESSTDNKALRGKGRLFALAGLALGTLTALTGLLLTAMFAYLVWRSADAASNGPDERTKAEMVTYFDSMNHQAAISVAVTVAGLIIVIISVIALERAKKIDQ